MSYQYRPCGKCGHVNASPKAGTKQNKRALAEELCRLMDWTCEEAFVVQNRSLSQEKLKARVTALEVLVKEIEKSGLMNGFLASVKCECKNGIRGKDCFDYHPKD